MMPSPRSLRRIHATVPRGSETHPRAEGLGAPFFAPRRAGDGRFCETSLARESVPRRGVDTARSRPLYGGLDQGRHRRDRLTPHRRVLPGEVMGRARPAGCARTSRRPDALLAFSAVVAGATSSFEVALLFLAGAAILLRQIGLIWYPVRGLLVDWPLAGRSSHLPARSRACCNSSQPCCKTSQSTDATTSPSRARRLSCSSFLPGELGKLYDLSGRILWLWVDMSAIRFPA